MHGAAAPSLCSVPHWVQFQARFTICSKLVLFDVVVGAGLAFGVGSVLVLLWLYYISTAFKLLGVFSCSD